MATVTAIQRLFSIGSTDLSGLKAYGGAAASLTTEVVGNAWRLKAGQTGAAYFVDPMPTEGGVVLSRKVTADMVLVSGAAVYAATNSFSYSYYVEYLGAGRFHLNMNGSHRYIETSLADGATATMYVTMDPTRNAVWVTIGNDSYVYNHTTWPTGISLALAGFYLVPGSAVANIFASIDYTGTSGVTLHPLTNFDGFGDGTVYNTSMTAGSLYTNNSYTTSSNVTVQGGRLRATKVWPASIPSSQDPWPVGLGIDLAAIGTAIGGSWAAGNGIEYQFTLKSGRGFTFGGAPFAANFYTFLVGQSAVTSSQYTNYHVSAGNLTSPLALDQPIRIRRAVVANGSGAAYNETGGYQLQVSVNGGATYANIADVNGAYAFGSGSAWINHCFGFGLPVQGATPSSTEYVEIDDLKVIFASNGFSAAPTTPPARSLISIYDGPNGGGA